MAAVLVGRARTEAHGQTGGKREEQKRHEAHEEPSHGSSFCELGLFYPCMSSTYRHTHDPAALRDSPDGQTLPHEPQLYRSSARSKHFPLTFWSEQLAWINRIVAGAALITCTSFVHARRADHPCTASAEE
jgi:hypothetical protein